MSLFNRNRKGKKQGMMVCESEKEKIININTNPEPITFTANTTPVEEPAAAPAEEWVWVDGFKGTDKDMKAQYDGFQYELGVNYHVAEPEEVFVCSYGYHFCLTLEDVFCYYSLEQTNNRFFKVRALVKKKDFYDYGKYDGICVNRINKLAARAIVLTEEIIDEKILIEAFYRKNYCEKLPEEYNNLIIQRGYRRAWNEYYGKGLLEKGFSETFVNIIVEKYGKDHIDRALAIADQEGVSMDMKVWFIFAGGHFDGR